MRDLDEVAQKTFTSAASTLEHLEQEYSDLMQDPEATYRGSEDDTWTNAWVAFDVVCSGAVSDAFKAACVAARWVKSRALFCQWLERAMPWFDRADAIARDTGLPNRLTGVAEHRAPFGSEDWLAAQIMCRLLLQRPPPSWIARWEDPNAMDQNEHESDDQQPMILGSVLHAVRASALQNARLAEQVAVAARAAPLFSHPDSIVQEGGRSVQRWEVAATATCATLFHPNRAQAEAALITQSRAFGEMHRSGEATEAWICWAGVAHLDVEVDFVALAMLAASGNSEYEAGPFAPVGMLS